MSIADQTKNALRLEPRLSDLVDDQTAIGIRKYGQALDDNNGSVADRARHLVQELVDAIQYACWLRNHPDCPERLVDGLAVAAGLLGGIANTVVELVPEEMELNAKEAHSRQPDLELLDRHPQLRRVGAERDGQVQKWGSQSRTTVQDWIGYLGEEFGELCKAVNEGDFEHAGVEANEVAAVAVKIVEKLERGGVSIPWPKERVRAAGWED